MPTYEYICGKCGHEFEVFQLISARPLRVCPRDLCAQKKWGRGSVKRKIGAGAGLIFKGSGFYTTDYRSRKYVEAAKKDAPPKKEPAKKESAPAKTPANPAK